MSYLDQQTVENILSHRPVYLATHERFDYEYTNCDVIAVDFAFNQAARFAIQAAIQNAVKDKKYAPNTRWYLKEIEGYKEKQIYWHDRWICSLVDKVTVEQWLPNRGKVEEHIFDFDIWFKQTIKTKHLSCRQVGAQLNSWLNLMASGTVPAELLQQMKKRTSHSPQKRWKVKDDRQEWVERYGTQAPEGLKPIDISLAPANTEEKTIVDTSDDPIWLL